MESEAKMDEKEGGKVSDYKQHDRSGSRLTRQGLLPRGFWWQESYTGLDLNG